MRMNLTKITSTLIHNHNRWLLHSATTLVLLLCFLLAVVEGSSGVSSGAVENETVGKFRPKYGASSLTSGPVKGSRSNLIKNDLDQPYTFTAMDDDHNDHDHDHDQEEEEEEEDDSSYNYHYDSFEDVNDTDDMDFISSHHDHENGKPVILKCCPIGQGLTLRGSCAKIREGHEYHSDNIWLPEKVFDFETEKKVEVNSSAWEVRYNQHHPLSCPEGHSSPEFIFDMKRFSMMKDGSLYSFDHKRLLAPLEFCVDLELGKGQGRVVKACFTKDELCDEKCLRKCCPKGSIAEEIANSPSGLRCEHEPIASNLTFKETKILTSAPNCVTGTRLVPISENDYKITENGTLETSSFSAPLLNYCLDYFKDRGKQEEPKLSVMMCFDDEYDGRVDLKGLIELPYTVGVVFGITMIISAICLAIAAVISWRLPELRSLHGKCQLSHLLTMFFLFVCLAIVHLWSLNVPQGLCTFLGVFIHICSLSSFLWLNLLCVNIYLTFRSLRPPLAARRDENRRLFFLCIYAWGIPAAFCLFLYALDADPGRLDPMPVPEYGKLKCLISNRQAEFAYLFGPVGVLLLCNGLLFCLTAQELLCGVWRLDNSDSINFRRKSMGIVVAKLGIVMGMGWILDVLSWAVGNQSPYMFYAADLFNSFQGVLISVILLWRKRVLEVLHLRRPSIAKDETLTARPFLPKTGSVNAVLNGDHDTSLVLVQDS